MNNIVAGDAVAAEGFITHVAFQVRIKNSILVINRAESAIGKIIVRVEIAAVALLLEIKQAEAMADNDPGREINGVLRDELQFIGVVAVRETLIVIVAVKRKSFRHGVRQVEPNDGHPNTIFNQFCGVAKHFTRQVCAGGAAEEFGIDAQVTGGKGRSVAVTELCEADARSGPDCVGQAGINLEKKIFRPVVSARIAGVGVPVTQPISLIFSRKITAERIAIQAILVAIARLDRRPCFQVDGVAQLRQFPFLPRIGRLQCFEVFRLQVVDRLRRNES